MPDIVSTILMLLFWVFVVNAIGRAFKKFFGGQQNKPTAKTNPTGTPEKQPQTFQEIFKELKKQIDESKQKQHIPPYAKQENKKENFPDLKTIQKESRRLEAEQRMQSPVQQKKYQHQEMIPLTEKQKALAYEKAVAKERKVEHDAEQRYLDKKILMQVEEEEFPQFQLDLRNAVIGSFILERKFDY